MSATTGTTPAGASPAGAAVAQRGPGGRRSTIVLVAAVAALAVATAGVLGGTAAENPLLALALVVAVPAAIVVAFRPEFATVIVTFLIYTNAVVVAVTFHGVPAFTAIALPGLLVIPLAYAVLVRREPIVVTRALPWIVALLIVQIMGVLFARDTNDALAELSSFAVEGIGIYVLLTNVIRTPDALRRVIWSLLVAGILLGGLSTYQELTKTYRNDYGGFARTDSQFATVQQTLAGSDRLPRQAGPIGEKNRYAQVMLMLVPLGLFVARSERRRSLQALALVAAGLSLVAVVLTFSRGAAVGFALVIAVMIALRYVRLWQVALTGLAIVALLAAVPQLGERLSTLEAVGGLFAEEGDLSAADTSVQSRLAENLTAIAVFADHPIIGVGPGQFSSFYREYGVEVGGVIRPEDRQAHNLYLEMAADGGVVGLTVFMGILGVTLWELRQARRRWLRTRPDLADIATGLSLMILTYMTTGVFLHLSYIRYFWLVMAIAGAGALILRRLPEPDRPAEDDQSANVQSVNPKFLPVRAGAGPRNEVP